MTRPIDDDGEEAIRFTAGLLFGMISAKQADAESPAGTVDEICDCGYVRGSFGCDDAHKPQPPVATFSRDLYVRCPTCTGSIPVGKHCGGPNCPLRK